MVADAVVFDVGPFQFASADLFAAVNGFKHRTIRVTAAADVINLTRARFLEKLPESLDKVVAVDVVAHLFALVAKHAIGRAVHRTTHEIGKKSVQFGAGVRRTGQAAAAKTGGLQAKIISVFLHQHIGGDFRCAEQRVLGLVNAHRFRNAGFVFVTGFDFPALFQFDERQAVRRVPVNLVRGSENEDRFGAELAGGFEQVERGGGVDAEIRVRITGRPVV